MKNEMIEAYLNEFQARWLQLCEFEFQDADFARSAEWLDDCKWG